MLRNFIHVVRNFYYGQNSSKIIIFDWIWGWGPTTTSSSNIVIVEAGQSIHSEEQNLFSTSVIIILILTGIRPSRWFTSSSNSLSTLISLMFSLLLLLSFVFIEMVCLEVACVVSFLNCMWIMLTVLDKPCPICLMLHVFYLYS